jgi:hypothetical protein
MDVDPEHRIIFEELAAIRAQVLQNTKLLQMLVTINDHDKTVDDLTKLYESDMKVFLRSIRDRLNKEPF